jgi:hypothetical protein
MAEDARRDALFALLLLNDRSDRPGGRLLSPLEGLEGPERLATLCAALRR